MLDACTPRCPRVLSNVLSVVGNISLSVVGSISLSVVGSIYFSVVGSISFSNDFSNTVCDPWQVGLTASR